MDEKRILLVDDEIDYARLITQILRDQGYKVEPAYSGREAIGAYVKSVHDNNPFDLVILDVRLPDMSGLEVLEVLRKEEECRGIRGKKRVPVIASTAYDEPYMDPDQIKGCDDYLIKSANHIELFRKIEERIAQGAKP